jgi:triosephosphate isomerase
MMPILCVGEPSRCGADEASASVAVQVRAALRHAPETRGIVVAYEPVWAIGQGATAAPRERIVRIHASIRTQLGRLLPADSSIRVIYGGSVDEESARRLFSEDEIDGVFVGRAALDVRRFAAIANTHVDDIPPPAGAGTVVE